MYVTISELIDADNVDQILKLALKYGLASKFTSFVAVVENENATVGHMQHRTVKPKAPPAASYTSGRARLTRSMNVKYDKKKKKNKECMCMQLT